jgi:hypothetical protein
MSHLYHYGTTNCLSVGMQIAIDANRKITAAANAIGIDVNSAEIAEFVASQARYRIYSTIKRAKDRRARTIELAATNIARDAIRIIVGEAA